MTHSKSSNIQSVDRRNFNKSLLAVTAAGMLPLSAFAQGKPKRTGVFRMALGHGSSTDMLDPAVLENAYQACLSNAVANTLTQVDPSGKVAPYLAETWEASADAKTWHFKMRKGVTFHDGSTLSPNDVLASID